ncbi:MAG: NAD(P)/FAD-dependent oxidoreductase [Gemmatimonadota bacterium]
MSNSYDAIVIGAGQNGLVAAALLAKSGRRVVVVESQDAPGGSARTREFHPGFKAGNAVHWSQPMDSGLAGELGIPLNGAVPIDPAVLTPLGDRALVLKHSVAETAEEIRKFSPADAGRWEEFCQLTNKISGFLAYLYASAPPRLTSTAIGDLFTLLGLGRKAKSLGKEDMVELLRVVPMAVAELLDDWFDSDALKGTLGAAGITGLCQGPRSAGTAFLFLHHRVRRPLGVFRSAGSAEIGPQLVEVVKKLSINVRTSSPVVRITTTNGQVSGVVLVNGEELVARQVLSTADPRRTMLTLVDPINLMPDFTRAVQNIRYRGIAARVDLALGELPKFRGVEGQELLRGLISISPSLDYLEKAYDDAKHGGVSKSPYLEAVIPSLHNASLAPAGKHVMSVWMQYAPYHLKSGSWDSAARSALGDQVIGCLGEYAPNLPGSVLAQQVLTPLDFERQLGATEGSLGQGELALDQMLFMRPVAGWGNYRTPIDGLYLGGAGSHPGPGLPGAAGRLAAKEMLKS